VGRVCGWETAVARLVVSFAPVLGALLSFVLTSTTSVATSFGGAHAGQLLHPNFPHPHPRLGQQRSEPRATGDTSCGASPVAPVFRVGIGGAAAEGGTHVGPTPPVGVRATPLCSLPSRWSTGIGVIPEDRRVRPESPPPRGRRGTRSLA